MPSPRWNSDGQAKAPDARGEHAGAFGDGQVRAAAGRPGDPFPDAIKCGPQVPEGTDPELGRRILFLNSYYRGNQVMRQDVYVKD